MALNKNTFNQSVQNPTIKSLVKDQKKEQNSFNSNQLFCETFMKNNPSSDVEPSIGDLSIKTSEAMVNTSQSRLLSMPLSPCLQSLDTISGESSDHLPTQSSLVSSPSSSLSELSSEQSQFISSIASTANTQDDKEKHLSSKSLNPLIPALDNMSSIHPLLSALSFSRTSSQQRRSDSQDSLSLLSTRCPSHESRLGSPGSITSLNETKLLSSSLSSLAQKTSNTAVPSQVKQPSENKNRKLTKLLPTSIGAVSLADLAKSHSSTSQHVPVLVTDVDAQKAQNFESTHQGTCPSLATLAQKHSKNIEGRSSFNVLSQSAAVDGEEKVRGSGKGEHQVSEVKALTLADLSQNQTLELDPFAHRTSSLLGFSNDSSQSPQPSLPAKSLSSSKELKVSSSLGNVFSLSELARAHDECNILVSLNSHTNLTQHQKHCNESLDLLALSTTNTQVEITDKTNSGIFVNAKPGLDDTMSGGGLWDAAAEFHGETSKSNTGETSHYKNTSKAMEDSDYDQTGLTLLTACLSSISVAEQQRISAVGSKVINTGELTPQLQRPGKRTGSKHSLIAKSSMFALTISSTYRLPRNRRKKLLTQSSFPPIDYGGNITAFDFSDPSPDDLVFEKQKKAFTKI